MEPIPPITPPQVPPQAPSGANVPVAPQKQPPTTNIQPPTAGRPWGKITLAISILILILIGWLSFGTVEINATPGADKVTINGKTAKIGKQKHMPGQLKITIEKEGYLTFEKTYRMGFHGALKTEPTLKKLPVAALMTEGITGELALSGKGQGAQGLSTDRAYIVRATFKKPTTAASSNTEEITDPAAAFNIEKLNLDPLPAIDSVQYPTDKRFALVSAQSGEIGILDFARRDVTSQDYAAVDANIKSAATTADGQNLFYWLFQPDIQKNFLVRDTLRRDKPDRFFDQPLIDQLGVTKLKFRWSPDAQKVLGIGEKTILVNILERKASILQDTSTLKDAWFSLDGKTIIGITADGQLLTIDLESHQLADHSVTTSANNLTIADQNTVFLIDSEGKFYSYNFDTKQKVLYLIDDKINASGIESWIVDATNSLAYFVAEGKLYTEPVVRGDYNE